jgi:hypothetical protein
MRGTYVYRDGELVPKHLAMPLNLGFMSRSHAVSSPMLNLDGCVPFQSMADGKMYDSKSEYRKTLKAGGYREIGDQVDAHMKEVTAEQRKPDVKGDLIKAYKKVKEGYKPPPPPMVHSLDRPDLD